MGGPKGLCFHLVISTWEVTRNSSVMLGFQGGPLGFRFIFEARRRRKCVKDTLKWRQMTQYMCANCLESVMTVKARTY